MARFWLNNDLTDRLAMLEQATDAHTGMVRQHLLTMPCIMQL